MDLRMMYMIIEYRNIYIYTHIIYDIIYSKHSINLMYMYILYVHETNHSLLGCPWK